MYRKTIPILLLFSISLVSPDLFGFEKMKSYAKLFKVQELTANDTDNQLWRGLLKDCSKKMSFSCIQKNVYSYLDETFTDRDNITVFDGLVLTKNNMDYEACVRRYGDLNENLVVGSKNEKEKMKREQAEDRYDEEVEENKVEAEDEKVREFLDDEIEATSPLEEVTNALRGKTIKFLATRDYELQLPEFFFEGATIKVSPREVDNSGALVRIDFAQRQVKSEGRLLFKKIKKFIANKLLTSFLALLLVIKLIKLKFFFIIPFLFGVGTAKKLFLKLLLFLVPAFAHIFKLCSSYYTHQGTKYYHHHHQIAHHHHHVPVPVPVPAYHHDHHDDYHDHPPHHYKEDYGGYEYDHPHIQYRKDVEELKEWGIEAGDDNDGHPLGVLPGPYGMPQYAANAKPVGPNPYHLPEKHPVQPPPLHTENRFPLPAPSHAQNLAYSAYTDDGRFTRATIGVTESIGSAPIAVQELQIDQKPGRINRYTAQQQQLPQQQQLLQQQQQFQQQQKLQQQQLQLQQQKQLQLQQQQKQLLLQEQQKQLLLQEQQKHLLQQEQQKQQRPANYGQQSVARPENFSTHRQSVAVGPNVATIAHDDEFYGPILERLDETFIRLKFIDDNCRERLVCNMYKNPALFSPHSNLVSNELSRDSQELKRGDAASASGRRFHRYLNAARLGQDGGDCTRSYACHVKTD